MNHILNLITQAAFTPFKIQKENPDNFVTEEDEEDTEKKKKKGQARKAAKKKKTTKTTPQVPRLEVGEDDAINFDSPLADSDEDDSTPYKSSYMLDEGEQDCLDDQLFLESIVDVETTDQVDDHHARIGLVLKKVSFLPIFSVTSQQLSALAKHLRFNNSHRQKFKALCGSNKIHPPVSLIRDVAHRWNSKFDMIDRALKVWDVM
jgi:hypothetical protein